MPYSVQSRCRENGIGRTRRWTRHLLRAHRPHFGLQTRAFDNLAGEIKPRTVSPVRGVHDTMSILSGTMQGSLSPDRRYKSEIRAGHSRHQAPDASPQASESYLENTFLPLRTAKTFARCNSPARISSKLQFRFGFGATINTLRISLIVYVVGKVLGAVEDVI